jgi:hypothetical protein
MSLTEIGTQCLKRAMAFEAEYLDIKGKRFKNAPDSETATYTVDCYTLFKEVTKKPVNTYGDQTIAALPDFVKKAYHLDARDTERTLNEYYKQVCGGHGHKVSSDIAIRLLAPVC